MGKVSSHGWDLNIMAICDEVVRRGRRLARYLEKPFAGI